MKTLRIGRCAIHALPVIFSFEGEDEKVRRAITSVEPDCVALGISPEDVSLLEQTGGDPPCAEFDMSVQHQAYLAHLSSYGDISIPPKDLVLAHALAGELDIPVETIDINDEEYAEALTELVSLVSLMRHGRRVKRLSKRKPQAETAEDFVVAWDGYLNAVPGFRKLETLREEGMARRLHALCAAHRRILAILPLERYEGTVAALERYKK